MNYVIGQVKLLACFLLTIIIIYTLSFSVAVPALSPTMDVNVLGTSEVGDYQLENFISYQTPEKPYDKNLLAAGYGIINLTEQRIILKNHSDIPLPIASLTKLMTAWVTLKYGSLQDSYTIKATDIESTKPSLNLTVGDQVLVQDLINAMLIGSNNDSAKALAGYVEEKTNFKFTDLMNQEATKLGMKNSRYSNPIGFDSNTNYSSVEDISLLVKALIPTNVFEATSRRTAYSFTSISGKSYNTTATNKLIEKYPDLSAIKTGFTNTALGSMVNLLKYNDQTYLLIVIGSPDREADTLELRNLVINP